MTGEDEEEAISLVVHLTHHHPSEPKNHEAEPRLYDGVPHYSLMEPLEALLLPVQPRLEVAPKLEWYHRCSQVLCRRDLSSLGSGCTQTRGFKATTMSEVSLYTLTLSRSSISFVCRREEKRRRSSSN
ncbi:hypothetical protein TanjilG_10972 [Lupinus angustifolius]|uniref:Uncharacterized protein n=1 Tax=Lupinus angustifolius TaxID=3871 RepID=A0A1J7IAT1_LUPAN|nr:hypothetical protein TanjilG_10972 [Lupinus angustifolius]